MNFSGTSSQTSMEVRHGVLGLERDYGTGNKAYERAMTVIIERLCTPYACHPLSTAPSAKLPKPRDAAEVIINPSKGLVVHDSGGDGTLDGKLLEHIEEKTHMVVADATGDGQLGLRT